MEGNQPDLSVGLFWQRMVLLALVPGFLGITFMGAIAHAWVEHTSGFGIYGLLFLSGPFLAWQAWRGRKWSGPVLFMALFAALWLPPWVIFSMSLLWKITVISALAFVLWLWLSKIQKPNPEVPA